MKGYIPISRSFFDSPFWSEERDYSRAEAWLDLIQRSRFEAGVQVVKNSVIELERGEQIASLRYLGKRWQWDKGRVGRFITLLEKMGQVRQEMRQGQSVLTLCNYDKYNSSKNGAIPLNETPNETRVRQQRDTSETKKKKGNKENKGNTTVDAPAIAWTSTEGWSGVVDKDLDDWKEAYPACDIKRQLASMNQWLLSNPSKAKKKQWRRFITNWMNRTQERGGDMASCISDKESGSPSTGVIKIGGRTGFIHSAAELKINDDDE